MSLSTLQLAIDRLLTMDTSSDSGSEMEHSQLGEFDIKLPECESDTSVGHESLFDEVADDELLGVLVDVNISSVSDPATIAEIGRVLTQSADIDLPRPEMPAGCVTSSSNSNPVKRFKSVTEDEIFHYEDQVQSKSV